MICDSKLTKWILYLKLCWMATYLLILRVGVGIIHPPPSTSPAICRFWQQLQTSSQVIWEWRGHSAADRVHQDQEEEEVNSLQNLEERWDIVSETCYHWVNIFGWVEGIRSSVVVSSWFHTWLWELKRSSDLCFFDAQITARGLGVCSRRKFYFLSFLSQIYALLTLT